MSAQLKAKRKQRSLTLDTLPIDLIYVIFEYCDTQSLSSLGCCCRKFYCIIRDDYVWLRKSCNSLATNQIDKRFQLRSCRLLSAREKCKISSFWRRGSYRESCLVSHKCRYLPWLCLERQYLWFSKGDTILKYKRFAKNGDISNNRTHQLRTTNEDICRFVTDLNFVITGGRKGSIAVWDKYNGKLLRHQLNAHSSEVNCVDSYDSQLIVSGSKDKSVKIWCIQSNHNSHQNLTLKYRHSIALNDRIWSLAVNEATEQLVIGTSACNQLTPLALYDLQSGQLVREFGDNYRRGSGVLHSIWESENQILSCGYDTCVRLWDTRDKQNCVLKCEDPHDSTVYCVATDHWVSFLSGTSRYGLTRLWDKRSTKVCVQMYYVGRNNSPVYSLCFDACHAYVALDSSINLLSFD